jgi:hypothetical protein
MMRSSPHCKRSESEVNQLIMRNFVKRAAVAIAAALSAAVVLAGVPPTAQAANDLWGGIALSRDGHWTLFWNASRNAADDSATWASCGADCRRVVLFNQCGALATDGGAFSPAEGASLQEAQDGALFDLTSPDARIIASHCNDGTGQGQIAWRP